MSTPYTRGGFKTFRGKGYGWRGKKSSYLSKNIKGDSLQSSSQKQPSRKNIIQNAACPYTKWELYFKDEAYIPGSELADKVSVLYHYFEATINQIDKDEIEEKQEVHLDFQIILNNPAISEKFPSLRNDIHEDPQRILAGIAVALHQVLLDEQFKDVPKSTHVIFDVPFIDVRLINFEPLTAFKYLKASSYGKLVSVRGTVVRVSNSKPIVTKMGFSCHSCSENQVLCLSEGKYAVPTKCSNGECRGKLFSPLRSSSLTETIDWQNIKIQEIISDELREAGRIPRTVECELTSGLVDSCVPGDVVTCTGIVKVTSEENNFGKNNDTSIYLLYIHAVSITNNKDNQSRDNVVDDGSSEFTLKELYAIREIQEEKKLFRLIVGSLCPTIYGLLLIKAGLALALFGGSQRYVDSKNLIPVRSDIHVLIVGDPGLGKSQMLQAIANVAPRSVYVCGSTTTTTGLTVTLSKESGTGNYSLEAGALVLADRGCCCIDEFDKMGTQHQALLEAMEQQSISIAKAGILCSLPARTSILAAANPVGGHYNRGKTVSENLKMGSALLSRFDLVFVLLDKPDEELDGILSEHVVSLHSDLHNIQSVTVERNRDCDQLLDLCNEGKPLIERLKIDKSESFDALPPQLLRKYIQYARKYVHPELSQDAANVLQEFYLNLRNQQQGSDSTPITTRQLEALIRLTEARARLELRESATAQDARDVIEIMKSSLIDTLSDEHGCLDYSRSQNGSGMSKRYQAKKFISELNHISERDKSSLFNVDQMLRIAKQLRLQTDDFEDFIASLNAQNYLLMKGPKLYQLQTSSCL